MAARRVGIVWCKSMSKTHSGISTRKLDSRSNVKACSERDGREEGTLCFGPTRNRFMRSLNDPEPAAILKSVDVISRT